MSLALITLSKEGAKVGSLITKKIPEARLYVHDVAGQAPPDAERFGSVVSLTNEIFNRYDGLVFIAPCGAVVRALAGNIRDKKTDPAVVVVDVGGRHAISLLSGHEGGANELAVAIGNAIGAEPVITTTTEAVKDIIVGVGCRKGKAKEAIHTAIRTAMKEAGVELDRVRYIASADIKSEEPGLLDAAASLNVPIRFIASEEIRESARAFESSAFVQEKVNLPAVAEPAALLAGRRTSLVQGKRKYNGITVAIAKENCSSLA